MPTGVTHHTHTHATVYHNRCMRNTRTPHTYFNWTPCDARITPHYDKHKLAGTHIKHTYVDAHTTILHHTHMHQPSTDIHAHRANQPTSICSHTNHVTHNIHTTKRNWHMSRHNQLIPYMYTFRNNHKPLHMILPLHITNVGHTPPHVHWMHHRNPHMHTHASVNPRTLTCATMCNCICERILHVYHHSCACVSIIQFITAGKPQQHTHTCDVQLHNACSQLGTPPHPPHMSASLNEIMHTHHTHATCGTMTATYGTQYNIIMVQLNTQLNTCTHISTQQSHTTNHICVIHTP